MSKHTPGPWAEHPRYTTRSPRIEQVDILDVDGQRVGAVLADDTEEEENGTILEVVSNRGKANARLIAAAPELLEALEETLSALVDYCDDASQNPTVQAARAAIAKATGGKP